MKNTQVQAARPDGQELSCELREDSCHPPFDGDESTANIIVARALRVLRRSIVCFVSFAVSLLL